MRLATLIVTSLLCTTSVSADESIQYERVLLPVTTKGELPGDLGSRWTTRVSILNNTGNVVDIQGYASYPHGCPILCGHELTAPGITFYPSVAPGAVTQGAILRIERRYSEGVEVHLRVQDVSRQSQTWGTEVPVVREKDLYQSTLNLLDIPTGSAFRQRLRIYDVDARSDSRVRVRFYRVNAATDTTADFFNPPAADVLIAERIIQLTTERRVESPTYDLGYAELANLAASVPELQSFDLVRIEITPQTAGLRFWSFVSVTNNETQHVTIISPH